MDSAAAGVFAQVDAGIVIAALLETRGMIAEIRKNEQDSKAAERSLGNRRERNDRISSSRDMVFAVPLLAVSMCVCLGAVVGNSKVAGFSLVLVLSGTLMGIWAVTFTPLAYIYKNLNSRSPSHSTECDGKSLSKYARWRRFLGEGFWRLTPIWMLIMILMSFLYLFESFN